MRRTGLLVGLLLGLGGLASAAGAQETERSWSGYVEKGPQETVGPEPGFTYVSATWIQPAVTCTERGARVAVWVGLDGDGTPTVEQAGTVAMCGSVGLPPLYYKAFWEMYDGPDSPGQEPFTVSPGDSIAASVTYQASGSYLLVVKDLTNGSELSVTEECGAKETCQRGTAEWIVERNGGSTYPLADYDTVTFTNIVAETAGQIVASDLITMVGTTGTTLSSCSLSSPIRRSEIDLPEIVFPFVSVICDWQAAQ
jgi:hypothetical protein